MNVVIEQLKLRTGPIVYHSGMRVRADGSLATDNDEDDVDYKITTTDNTIKGYLAVWGVRDTYGTAFVKGCFSKSILERGPGSASKCKIAFLWQHDMRDPIGQFLVLREDDYGLYFEAAVDDVPNGIRALKQYRSGTLNQCSFGFIYIWDKMEYKEEQDLVLVYEVDLQEGSVVTIGSNTETYLIRSPEEYAAQKLDLDDDTEDVIKMLPRKDQLAVRQIIARQISLSKAEPLELRQKALRPNGKPTEDVASIAEDKLSFTEILKFI